MTAAGAEHEEKWELTCEIQQLIKLVRPYYSRAEWKKMRMPKTRHLIYHDYSVGDLTLLRDALAANLAAHR